MAVGRWASAPVPVGCEWKVKANLNTRETRSARIHASIISHPYPQCCGVVYVTQRVWAPFLTSTSIFTTVVFCLYNQASGYKELVIHTTVHVNSTLLLHLLLMLFYFTKKKKTIKKAIAFSCVTYFVKAYLWILHGPWSFKFLFLACSNGGHWSFGRRGLVHNSLGASDINCISDKWGHCVIFLSSSSFPG